MTRAHQTSPEFLVSNPKLLLFSNLGQLNLDQTRKQMTAIFHLLRSWPPLRQHLSTYNKSERVQN